VNYTNIESSREPEHKFTTIDLSKDIDFLSPSRTMEKERLYKRTDDNAMSNYAQLRQTYKTINNLKEDLRKSLLEGNNNLKIVDNNDNLKEQLNESINERADRENKMFRYNGVCKPNLFGLENTTYELEGEDYIKNFGDMGTLLSGNQNDFSGINFNKSFISTHLKKDLSHFSVKQMPKYIKTRQLSTSDYNFKFRELETKVTMIEGMMSDIKPTNVSRYGFIGQGLTVEQETVLNNAILKTFEHEGRKWVFVKKDNRYEWLSDEAIEFDVHSLRLVPLNETEEKYKSVRSDLMKKEYELVDLKKAVSQKNMIIEELQDQNRKLQFDNDRIITENGSLENKHHEELYNLLAKSDEEIRMARDKLNEYIKELERFSKENKILKEDWDKREKQVVSHYEERLRDLKKANENEIIASTEYEVKLRELQERLTTEESKNFKLSKTVDELNSQGDSIAKTSRKKKSDNSNLPKVMMNELVKSEIVKSTSREIPFKFIKNISFSFVNEKRLRVYDNSVAERFSIQNSFNKLVIKEIKSVEGIEELRMKLKEKERWNGSLESKISELETNIAELNDLIKEKGRILSDKEQEINHYESEKPLKEKMQEDLKAKRKQIVELEAKIKDRDEEIESLKLGEVELTSQHNAAIEEAMVGRKKEINEIQQLSEKKLNEKDKLLNGKETELTSLKEKVERLETQIKTFRDAQNDHKTLKENADGEITSLQKELDATSLELRELEALIQSKEDEIASLLKTSTEVKNALEDKIASITGSCYLDKQTLEDKLTELTNSLNDTQIHIKNKDVLIQTLKSENDELNKTIENLGNRVSELESDIRIKTLENIECDRFELESGIRIKTVEYIECERFELKAVRSGENLKNELQKKKSELLEIQIQNEETEAKIDKLNDDVDQLTEALRILTKENVNLKTDNINLKENIDDILAGKKEEIQRLRDELIEKDIEIDTLKQTVIEKDKEIIAYFEQLTFKDNEIFSIRQSKSSEKDLIKVEQTKANEYNTILEQLNQKIAELDTVKQTYILVEREKEE
jgi:chromosome segregation ATPase